MALGSQGSEPGRSSLGGPSRNAFLVDRALREAHKRSKIGGLVEHCLEILASPGHVIIANPVPQGRPETSFVLSNLDLSSVGQRKPNHRAPARFTEVVLRLAWLRVAPRRCSILCSSSKVSLSAATSPQHPLCCRCHLPRGPVAAVAWLAHCPLYSYPNGAFATGVRYIMAAPAQ